MFRNLVSSMTWGTTVGLEGERVQARVEAR